MYFYLNLIYEFSNIFMLINCNIIVRINIFNNYLIDVVHINILQNHYILNS